MVCDARMYWSGLYHLWVMYREYFKHTTDYETGEADTFGGYIKACSFFVCDVCQPSSSLSSPIEHIIIFLCCLCHVEDVVVSTRFEDEINIFIVSM